MKYFPTNIKKVDLSICMGIKYSVSYTTLLWYMNTMCSHSTHKWNEKSLGFSQPSAREDGDILTQLPSVFLIKIAF